MFRDWIILHIYIIIHVYIDLCIQIISIIYFPCMSYIIKIKIIMYKMVQNMYNIVCCHKIIICIIFMYIYIPF